MNHNSATAALVGLAVGVLLSWAYARGHLDDCRAKCAAMGLTCSAWLHDGRDYCLPVTP